jgi:hypothetical protein
MARQEEGPEVWGFIISFLFFFVEPNVLVLGNTSNKPKGGAISD